MRTVRWNSENDVVEMIDQRFLPGAFEIVSYSTHEEIANAITDMVIRGAPAIGAAAAFGLALAAQNSSALTPQTFLNDICF